MNKKEFLSKLKKKLKELPYEEQERILQYYKELLEDKIENGANELEAVESLGSITEIWKKIQADQEEKKTHPKNRILIVGSPIILILYLCAFLLDLSLGIVAASLIGTTVVCIIILIPSIIISLFYLLSSPIVLIFQIGMFILVTGIICFLFLGSYYTLLGTKKFFLYLVDSIKAFGKEVLS